MRNSKIFSLILLFLVMLAQEGAISVSPLPVNTPDKSPTRSIEEILNRSINTGQYGIIKRIEQRDNEIILQGEGQDSKHSQPPLINKK